MLLAGRAYSSTQMIDSGIPAWAVHERCCKNIILHAPAAARDSA
jgi:hypothetical protein